jgi:hypothetical protein
VGTKKPNAKRAVGGKQTDPAVVAFLKDLDHPLKKEIESVRAIVLGVSPAIREGIKWNAPSFRTSEYFATMNLRQNRVWLILHFGAKVKDNTKAIKISDPTSLLKWLANDRALVTFEDAKDVKAKRAGLEAIIREWIQYV